MHMKKLLIFCLFFSQLASAQTLTLEQVQQKAKQQYPLLKQKDLIQQVKDINIENLRKGFLPQV